MSILHYKLKSYSLKALQSEDCWRFNTTVTVNITKRNNTTFVQLSVLGDTAIIIYKGVGLIGPITIWVASVPRPWL